MRIEKDDVNMHASVHQTMAHNVRDKIKPHRLLRIFHVQNTRQNRILLIHNDSYLSALLGDCSKARDGSNKHYTPLNPEQQHSLSEGELEAKQL